MIITDPSFEDHRWFTPSPADADYLSSFQGHYALAAHVHLTYDAARTTATAEILADTRDANATLTYIVGGVAQDANTFRFTALTHREPVTVAVADADGVKIELEPIDLVWNAPAVHPIEEAKGQLLLLLLLCSNDQYLYINNQHK